MENDLEHDIRKLAYHIWQTAGREFGQTALDFWEMAERMVIEPVSYTHLDVYKRQNPASSPGIPNVRRAGRS